MKIKNLSYLLLSCLLISTVFSSCNEDSPNDLLLSVSRLYAKLGRNVSFMVWGNGGYSVDVANPATLTATVSENGTVTVTPLAIGSTTVKVTDSELLEKQATIEVMDPYLAFYVIESNISVLASDENVKKEIEKSVQDTLVFEKDHIYDFIMDETKTYNVYKENWISSRVANGTYSFDAEKGNFSMVSGLKKSTLVPEAGNRFAKIFYDYFTTSTEEPEYTSDANSTFTLTEDLLEKYTLKYPDANITEVKVTIQAGLLNSHRFELRQ